MKKDIKKSILSDVLFLPLNKLNNAFDQLESAFYHHDIFLAEIKSMKKVR